MLEKMPHLIREAKALYLALGHRDTPLVAKVWLAFAVAYIVSPIDLIPDFIPVIGYLDDLLLIPVSVWIADRLIPVEVMEECRARADEAVPSQLFTWVGGGLVALIWFVGLVVTFYGIEVFFSHVQT